MKVRSIIVSILIAGLFLSACVENSRKDESRNAAEYLSPNETNFNEGSGTLVRSKPEDAGVSSTKLNLIDQIASDAIRQKAAPSITIMVIKDSKVIFDKAYGTHTYTDRSKTRLSDIYDLASLTKISATTLVAMQLYEQGKLDLDATVGSYLPETRRSNKKDIRVRDLMLHEAGLVPQIPFHLMLEPGDHSRDSTPVFTTKVAENYFLRRGYYKEVMWPGMLKSELLNKGRYVYSDLSMYILKEIVEKQAGRPLEHYVQENFYKPLGMIRTGFNPRRRFKRDSIIPTEQDNKFRKDLLRGYVHDEGAALAGGVSGHAGLFSSANDLSILFQMLLNRGTYGGRQYFKPETVDLFTAKQSSVSRRGLGFDRWDPKSAKGFPSKLASPETYGHTGYTGTCVWVDPKYQLIYIFLSNRVHPNRSDKLNKLNIRGRVQDVIYKAFLKDDR